MTDETEVWQDIATAPKEKDVLVFCPAGHCTKVFVAYIDDDGAWLSVPDLKLVANNSGDPSHWMPLPPPPKEQSNER